jgi:hypothetical protein
MSFETVCRRLIIAVACIIGFAGSARAGDRQWTTLSWSTVRDPATGDLLAPAIDMTSIAPACPEGRTCRWRRAAYVCFATRTRGSDVDCGPKWATPILFDCDGHYQIIPVADNKDDLRAGRTYAIGPRTVYEQFQAVVCSDLGVPEAHAGWGPAERWPAGVCNELTARVHQSERHEQAVRAPLLSMLANHCDEDTRAMKAADEAAIDAWVRRKDGSRK